MNSGSRVCPCPYAEGRFGWEKQKGMAGTCHPPRGPSQPVPHLLCGSGPLWPAGPSSCSQAVLVLRQNDAPASVCFRLGSWCRGSVCLQGGSCLFSGQGGDGAFPGRRQRGGGFRSVGLTAFPPGRLTCPEGPGKMRLRGRELGTETQEVR